MQPQPTYSAVPAVPQPTTYGVYGQQPAMQSAQYQQSLLAYRQKQQMKAAKKQLKKEHKHTKKVMKYEKKEEKYHTKCEHRMAKAAAHQQKAQAHQAAYAQFASPVPYPQQSHIYAQPQVQMSNPKLSE